MSTTRPSPRVTTERVARYIEAHRVTGSTGAVECDIAADLLDARERTVKLDAALDAALLVTDQYHATLFGTPKAKVAG